MNKHMKKWQKTLDTIINGIDTPLGRAFDIALIFSIICSSSLIILDSVVSIHLKWGATISVIQSIFLMVFTIEFILRMLISSSKKHYIFSFYGIVDFLAIAPIYLSLLFPFGSFFPIIRTLRLLRLFSVFKMGRYIDESGALLKALKASKVKISVFLVTIVFVIVIVGALMYVIEGPENGFVNIPESMYWAVVTISTVGYGDISPQTIIGKFIASNLMLVGYGIIAVPTGIITSELTQASRAKKNTTADISCDICGEHKHPQKARYCFKCGHQL